MSAIATTIALQKKKITLLKIVSFLSLIVLLVIIYQIFHKRNIAFDYWIFNEISFYVSDTITSILLFFTIFGSDKFLVPAWFALAILYYIVYREKLGIAKILGIGFFNLGIMFLLKFLFDRPRPTTPLISEVDGLSFPSGHAFMAFTFFSIIIYFIQRDIQNTFIKYILTILLTLIICIIGFSRIYLRLHYTTDVIAGYCFGILSFILFYFIQNIIHHKKYPT